MIVLLPLLSILLLFRILLLPLLLVHVHASSMTVCSYYRARPCFLLALIVPPGDRTAKAVNLKPKKSMWMCKAFGWTLLPKGSVLCEIEAALKDSRGSRTNAMWKGNKALPTVSLEIRGHTLEFINDIGSLQLVLNGDMYDDLQRVVNEIYKDLHAPSKIASTPTYIA
eukprot:1127392-Pyramimonas_sp.AAC.1